MDLQLNGRTAVVTGAGRGIGLAIARALTHEGARVIGAARTVTPELDEVAVATVAADLSREAGATAVMERAAELGGLDILVNSVGAGDADRLGLGGFLDVDDDQWRDLFDRNLFSAVWMTRAALPSLLARGGGAIVNIASINSRVPSTGPVGYSEAKAALTAFGKRLSEEFAPRGVRVNTVSPGPVRTALWQDPAGFGGRVAAAMGVAHDDFLAAMPELFAIASGRMTEPEEVGALVTFLASGAAANIVGADIVIDGGIVKTS